MSCTTCTRVPDDGREARPQSCSTALLLVDRSHDGCAERRVQGQTFSLGVVRSAVSGPKGEGPAPHASCDGTGPLPWLRGQDLNLRPSGYEPDELPDCSTPRQKSGPPYRPGDGRCQRRTGHGGQGERGLTRRTGPARLLRKAAPRSRTETFRRRNGPRRPAARARTACAGRRWPGPPHRARRRRRSSAPRAARPWTARA
jgi:hypothetical protein